MIPNLSSSNVLRDEKKKLSFFNLNLMIQIELVLYVLFIIFLCYNLLSVFFKNNKFKSVIKILTNTGKKKV